MQKMVKIQGKEVDVRLSQAAERALALRSATLYAEMELYFSCLIRFKVRFYEDTFNDEGVVVSDKLILNFRPVMTAKCNTHYQGNEPPVTDFPITKGASFVPKWLTIDFSRGRWRGEFGLSMRR